MAQVIPTQRKSPVLKHPTLPCLAPHYTINLTAGCPYACRYCYAQSFRSHPGQGKVIFYANTPDLLERELSQKRKKVELVYFSTACEPFAPYPEVLDALYRVMQMLLARSVSLLISTKSVIPQLFEDLFAAHTEQVHVQLGLTTVNDDVRRLLEPSAATVSARLETARRLVARGIPAEIRADPLTPGLTDTDESVCSLLQAVADAGVHRMVVSYLFLRPGNIGRLRIAHGAWSFAEMASQIYTSRIDRYCGGGSVRVPAQEHRRERFKAIASLARGHGVQIALCKCKNPDLTDACCHPIPDSGYPSDQKRLFH
ncbi:MAG: radical SAM protein [Planctomycetota bacterium]